MIKRFLILSLILISCSSSDKQDISWLIGTWENEFVQTSFGSIKSTITFYEDGSASGNYISDYNGWEYIGKTRPNWVGLFIAQDRRIEEGKKSIKIYNPVGDDLEFYESNVFLDFIYDTNSEIFYDKAVKFERKEFVKQKK